MWWCYYVVSVLAMCDDCNVYYCSMLFHLPISLLLFWFPTQQFLIIISTIDAGYRRDALEDSSYCNTHTATTFLQFHMNIRSGWFDLACFMQVLIREEFTLHQDIILETHHLYIVITVNVVWYNCLYIIYLVVFGICIWCIVVCYSQFCDARQYIRKGFHVYLRKKCFFDHRLIFCWHLT